MYDSLTLLALSVEELLSALASCLWTERVAECDCESVSSRDSILSNGVADAIAFPFSFAFAHLADDCDSWVFDVVWLLLSCSDRGGFPSAGDVLSLLLLPQ
ncbi:hypothetical protein BHE74_00056915 [Ensete ventricosum]|nr:hypothetical protein GW17_00041346 [Ensete ventricosum]RWW37908.1 hypothetical protein BHE74_00056915 [Ensete ventricosum]RZS20809.1 hypothetical protein BHM03_00053370 [Ensete ventricosum]